MAINQDDALGVGEEYSDTQGMLGSGRGKARPTPPGAERDGREIAQKSVV